MIEPSDLEMDDARITFRSTDLEGVLNVYRIHRKAEEESRNPSSMQFTTATVCRLLRYIHGLQAKITLAQDLLHLGKTESALEELEK